jgi:hypothetical protein
VQRELPGGKIFCVFSSQSSKALDRVDCSRSSAQLKAAAGSSREDTPGTQIAKLEAFLAQTTDNVATTAAAFADLLGIPAGDRYPRSPSCNSNPPITINEKVRLEAIEFVGFYRDSSSLDMFVRR